MSNRFPIFHPLFMKNEDIYKSFLDSYELETMKNDLPELIDWYPKALGFVNSFGQIVHAPEEYHSIVGLYVHCTRHIKNKYCTSTPVDLDGLLEEKHKTSFKWNNGTPSVKDILSLCGEKYSIGKSTSVDAYLNSKFKSETSRLNSTKRLAKIENLEIMVSRFSNLKKSGVTIPSKYLELFPHLEGKTGEFEYMGPETPDVPTEDRKHLLARAISSPDKNTWNHVIVDEVEFDDNKEMLKAVKEHLSPFPEIEIITLKKVKLAYFSDGGMSLTPDAINNTKGKPLYYKGVGGYEINYSFEPIGSKITSPCIYYGEAWQIYFLVRVEGKLVDFLQGCRLFFATPDQYYNAYKDVRPDLVQDFKPWSDFIFISSDWCERNRLSTYNKGIDLQTPNQRRMSLLLWIIGPCASHCMQFGTGKFPSLISLSNGAVVRDRRKKLENYLETQREFYASPEQVFQAANTDGESISMDKLAEFDPFK